MNLDVLLPTETFSAILGLLPDLADARRFTTKTEILPNILSMYLLTVHDLWRWA
jgi:hypothetical protein